MNQKAQHAASGEPTDEEFRAAGYMPAARQFPLSERAFTEKCRWNGITPEQAPRAWRYAPNSYCHDMWESGKWPPQRAASKGKSA